MHRSLRSPISVMALLLAIAPTSCPSLRAGDLGDLLSSLVENPTAFATSPNFIAQLARSPKIVTEVEGACIDRQATQWEEQEAFREMWKMGIRMAEDAQEPYAPFPVVATARPLDFTPHHAYNVYFKGPMPVHVAERHLASWRETYGKLLYEVGPQAEPGGDQPLLSGEYPTWRQGSIPIEPTSEFSHVYSEIIDPQDPKWVASAAFNQASVLFAAGRIEEGLASLEASFRFVRILNRGHRSRRDFTFVAKAAFMAANVRGPSRRLALNDWLSPEVRGKIEQLIDNDRVRQVSWRVFINRSLKERRCAIGYVDDRLEGFSEMLFGDSLMQLDTIRAWALDAHRGRRPSSRGMHPVLAYHLPRYEALFQAHAHLRHMELNKRGVRR